ncbi:MAG: DNA cytosine methyltransferase, partial [Candidatus Methylumidiphilus sp.]
RECARLQGFPDSFQCHPIDTHAYRQFGNSVSMPVVRNVILDLFRHSGISFHAKQIPPVWQEVNIQLRTVESSTR